MKTEEFFSDFEWDGLVDFRLKAPYIPQSFDAQSNLKDTMSPYEAVIEVIFIFLYQLEFEMNKVGTSIVDDDVPKDYDKKWADEF